MTLYYRFHHHKEKSMLIPANQIITGYTHLYLSTFRVSYRETRGLGRPSSNG